ncbi:PD-(D/E)XK nuclease family protein [Salinimonas marina]|uniref:PD-(D/E)XK nuclease family protein n=1 Tax=Salinimonas marina TaxID=2785918 RepID=A0A7S9DZH3_9ALTE|nr:3'-5' exonuclease [Salinimonas marina]QPG06765.1 PD-(D/E)XK nuclease family protein [Salinimonas marina]
MGDKPAKGQLQQQLARWVADEIVRLLNGARLGEDALQPQDIAILVRSGPEAAVVQNALRRVNLASVFLSNRTNLFASHEAQDLYRVLDGIWHYQQSHRLSAALSSPLFGLSHAQLTNLLYHEDDNAWEAMMDEVLLLRQMWQQRGCMTLILYLLEEHFASFEDSMERRLTNYLHLAEVLERESAVQEHAQQLLIWLHRQISEPQLAQEQIQRLESDAQLIQLVTQHGSKGLEYPIVFVPFASDYRDPAKVGKQYQAMYRYYDEQTAGLTLLLGRSDRAIERVRREGNAESTRLLYVAVTRAAQRCYLGVAPFENHQQSALAQALDLGEAQDWSQAIDRVIAEGGEHTACTSVPVSLPVRALQQQEAPNHPLSVDTFTGEVTERWRLYSFSALARRQMVVNRTRREAELDNARLLADEANESDTASLPFRFRFTKGAAAGNLLHDILEHCDFTQPDWQSGAMDMAQRFGVEHNQLPNFFQWLDEVLAAPLNNDGLTLDSLPETATLREAEFYFPLNTVNLFQLNQFLAGYRQQAAGQGPFMVNLDTKKLEGLMHGFIDLIFVFEGRYFVADYKSTHLGDSYAGYQQARLTQNNQHHLYDLQYLIYAVALHRYLQTKLPGYHPSSHFGGVYYLYLRGMHPDNQEHQGVYHARPTDEQLLALDAIFKHAEAS